MFEFHGWFRLVESTYEDDERALAVALRDLRALLAKYEAGYSMHVDLRVINGAHILNLSGFANHRRDPGEAGAIREILEFLLARLPGSWGLLYERDDETEEPPGPNHFRVRTLARGKVTERRDPWLSPCRPTIED